MNTSQSKLANDMQGMWWLLSRLDRNAAGLLVDDPILGADPVSILAYANGKFTAQFMKRDRSTTELHEPTAAGQNNTAASGGYDAYFGEYEVEENGLVRHTLQGSVNPSNVGMTVQRSLKVDGDQLVIELGTTSVSGEPVTRTLTWKRIG